MNFGKLVKKCCKGWRMVVAVAFVLALAACGTQNDPAKIPSVNDDPTVLLEQLEGVKQNLSISKLPLRIVEMTFGATLESDVQVNELRNRLVSTQALVPQYDGVHAESFSLSTVGERMSNFQRDSQTNQNVIANIQSQVFPLIKAGQRTVDLTWESEGEQFHTTTVYDEQGVVYDNILSNIALVEEAQPNKLETIAKIPDMSGLQTQATHAFTARALDYTIKWIWGGKRGKITVDHTIIWNGSNYIYDQSGSAHHWMSVGSTGAETKNVALSRSRYAKIAYGYAWATPTADFSISYDANKASFNVSLNGVGSKGGGDAHHTITLP